MTIENPALTQVYSRVNGGGTTFTTGATPFEDDDVFVYIFNESTGNYEVRTVTTDYTLSGSTVTFNSPTPSGTGNILILRRSDFNALQIPNFTPGSSIRGQDLDSNFEQLLRVCQEHRDLKVDKFFPEIYADLDLNGNRIENVGDAVDDGDAPNRKQLGDVIALDVTSNETQGIVLEKTQSGSNSGDEMVITAHDSSATQKGTVIIVPEASGAINVDYNSGTATIGVDKSTAVQQGVVKITTPVVTDGNPITLTRPADGEIELTIENGSIDVQKIKGLDKADTSEYYLDWTGDDDQVATVGALEARHDLVVDANPNPPTTLQTGKQWLSIAPGNQVHKIYDGSGWRTVAVGQPYIPGTNTIVRYVDATNGSDQADVTGYLPQAPLRSIKRAVDLVNTTLDQYGNPPDGSLILVQPGVYQEILPIQIQRKNISIVGTALRSVFVQPTQATETNTMFECNTGTLLANMTFVGLKASGTRGNSTYDSDSTYGLPENQGWCAAFFNNAIIKKSPYIQNCTSFNDSSIDNSEEYDQTNLQPGGLGGDLTSSMSGGGILCDGSTVSSNSPVRSFVVDSFTQINLDGPGILCTNNGYAQLVSFFGTFCHYHAKSLNGGQLNLSNCTTDFGRYGLVADGKSPTNIFTGTANGTFAAGQVTFTISSTTADASWHGDNTNPRPLDNMLVQIGGNADGTGGTIYAILESDINGSGYDVTIANPNPNDLAENLGLAAELTSGTTIRFFLRSTISTGGHTFEFCGSGTDYTAHPDNGGVAVRVNQTKNLNDGKVWQSSTDENGQFSVGETFIVDQKTGQIIIPPSALNVVNRTSPTGAAIMPSGTTAERDTSPVNGYLRYNQTLDEFEGYINGNWGAVGGVNKIVAGSNVTISPTDGTGIVTINASGGGGGSAGVTNVATGTGLTGGPITTTGTVSLANTSVTADTYTNANITVDAQGRITAASSGSVNAINNIVDDTTPQLGGNLDVNGQDIVSTSNGAINLDPNGSGVVVFKGNTTKGSGQLKLNCENNSHGITIKGPPHSANATYTLTLPDTAGGNNQSLVSNGSGGLSWNSSPAIVSNTWNLGIGAVLDQYGFGSGTSESPSRVYNTYIGESVGSNTGTGNTVVGAVSGYALAGTAVGGNTYIGAVCGYLAKGGGNTIVGGNAFSRDQTAGQSYTGYSNCALGGGALMTNTTGYENCAVGTLALRYNTTGDRNIAVGNTVMQGNTTGNHNTSIGDDARYGPQTSTYNVDVGADAGRANNGNYNVNVGWQAGYNLSNSSCVSIGTQTNYNTTGSNNIGVGYRASHQPSGSYNIGLGENSSYGSSGSYNASVGSQSGYGGNGSYNLNLGWQAGYTNSNYSGNSNGNENINIGYRAGMSQYGGRQIAIGYEAGRSQYGYRNISLGEQAGYYLNNSAEYNVLIGYQAGKYSSNGWRNGSNNICIGKEADTSTTSISNEITLGNASISSLRCNVQTISSLSDGRDKTEVENLPLGLDFIDTLRPVKFKWETRDGNGKDGSYSAGFIAQDLQSVQEDSNAEYLDMVMDSNPDRLEARYGQLIPVLVQAIKDLKTEIETLKSNV